MYFNNTQQVQNPYNSRIIYDFTQGYLLSEIEDDIQEQQIQNNILITQLLFNLLYKTIKISRPVFQLPNQWILGALSKVVKEPGRKGDNSLPSRVQDSNVYVFMAWFLIT
jgi:hypothetical protein